MEILRLGLVIVSAPLILSRKDQEITSTEWAAAVNIFQLFIKHHREVYVVQLSEGTEFDHEDLGDFFANIAFSYVRRLYKVYTLSGELFAKARTPACLARSSTLRLFQAAWTDNFVVTFGLPPIELPDMSGTLADDTLLFEPYEGRVVPRRVAEDTLPSPGATSSGPPGTTSSEPEVMSELPKIVLLQSEALIEAVADKTEFDVLRSMKEMYKARSKRKPDHATTFFAAREQADAAALAKRQKANAARNNPGGLDNLHHGILDQRIGGEEMGGSASRAEDRESQDQEDMDMTGGISEAEGPEQLGGKSSASEVRRPDEERRLGGEAAENVALASHADSPRAVGGQSRGASSRRSHSPTPHSALKRPLSPSADGYDEDDEHVPAKKPRASNQ